MQKPLLIFLLILLISGNAFSAPVGLYTGDVLVENQQKPERNRALPQALKQVLQKLSGMGNFDEYPQLEPMLNRASAIVVSFHYRNVEATLADSSVADQLHLVAIFAEAEVNEIMRELQLPLWPAERQPVEIWVVVDDGAGRRIMPVEYAYAWGAMNTVAAIRGQAVVWPQPDEEGIYPVNAQLLWGGYTEDITGDDGAIMIAAARREGIEWSVRLNLDYGGQTWAWRLHDVDLQQALGNSMHEAVNRVAASNTIAAIDQGQWLHQLTVSGIVDAEDYRLCLGYLQNLSIVDRVSVTAASRGVVHFSLELNATPLYLDETLASGSLLDYYEADNSWALHK
jgi:hypothetical protein